MKVGGQPGLHNKAVSRKIKNKNKRNERTLLKLQSQKGRNRSFSVKVLLTIIRTNEKIQIVPCIGKASVRSETEYL